jgi:hypothetical protein
MIVASAEELPNALIHLVEYIIKGNAPTEYRPEASSSTCLIYHRDALLGSISPFSM